MTDPWNDSSILSPPVNTCKCEIQIDIKQLSHTFNGIIKVLSNQSPLHKEAAVCSRFIYKFDKKFRNDIGYRNLKKVNTALRRYLALNLLKDVENFVSVLPDQDEELYLPTRQMLEYVLLRLLAFSKILLRSCVCSKQAAIFYLDRVKRGESHWMSLMPFALISRIWSISMVLLQHSCNWYTNLYPFLEKLKLKGVNILPLEYRFPNNIEEWLDMKNLDNMGRLEWSQKKIMKFDQIFIEDEEGDTLDNILEFVDKINEVLPMEDEVDADIAKPLEQKLKPSEELPLIKANVDQGEKISREIFKSFFKPNAAPLINHSADRITNKQTLKKFISTEEELRNGNSSQSLTSHLSFMQWQTLKKSLLSLHDSIATNRKIERKFQKLWKDKCLDYK